MMMMMMMMILAYQRLKISISQNYLVNFSDSVKSYSKDAATYKITWSAGYLILIVIVSRLKRVALWRWSVRRLVLSEGLSSFHGSR